MTPAAPTADRPDVPSITHLLPPALRGTSADGDGVWRLLPTQRGAGPDPARRFEGAYGALYASVIRSRAARTAIAATFWGRGTALGQLDEFLQDALARVRAREGAAGGDVLATAATGEVVARERALLDVPCGGGSLLHWLGNGGFDGLVVEADLASRMLVRARARHASMGTRAPAAAFVQCDALAQPFADDGFDAAIAINGLHCMPDPIRFLDELARVVRPGGIVALTTMVSTTSLRHRYVMRVAREAGIIPAPAPTERQLRAAIASAGLEVLDTRGKGGLIGLICRVT